MQPRRATAEDVPAVAELVQRAYQPWVAVIGQRPAPMDDDYAAHCATGDIFVLPMDGALAAILVVQDRADHLWLDNIAVDQDFQGRGIGRALLAFTEVEARQRGLREIRLLTHQQMLSNITLYARCGYVETERRVQDGFARVFMAKRL